MLKSPLKSKVSVTWPDVLHIKANARIKCVYVLLPAQPGPAGTGSQKAVQPGWRHGPEPSVRWEAAPALRWDLLLTHGPLSWIPEIHKRCDHPLPAICTLTWTACDMQNYYFLFLIWKKHWASTLIKNYFGEYKSFFTCANVAICAGVICWLSVSVTADSTPCWASTADSIFIG